MKCKKKKKKPNPNLTPSTHISHGLLQKLSGMDLLSLTHGDIACFNLQSFSQRNNWIRWVWTHWQEANERSSWIWFLPGLLQIKNYPLCIPRTHRIHNVFPSLTEKRKSVCYFLKHKDKPQRKTSYYLRICVACPGRCFYFVFFFGSVSCAAAFNFCLSD